MAVRAESIADGIPLDTFGTRLAIVRQALGGWNVKKAAEHFDLDPGSWRNWEAGGSCRNRESVCRVISDRTGISYEWLMIGGALRSRCFRQMFSVVEEPIVQPSLPGIGWDRPVLEPV